MTQAGSCLLVTRSPYRRSPTRGDGQIPVTTTKNKKQSLLYGIQMPAAGRIAEALLAELSILIIDDDPDIACAAQMLLRKQAARISTLEQPQALGAKLAGGLPDVVLLDLNFTPGRADGAEGLALLAELRALPTPPTVIVMTAYADIPLAVKALQQGAADFVTKPWDNDKLVATVASALAGRHPQQATAGSGTSQLLGDSSAMRNLRALIASIAPTEASVLILGENGVGKELVARAIHDASRRARGTFLAVDMGALPESTFESELFGHRRGAFTDARSDRAGRFQTARGGTLFLDEIGNMPLGAQAKLLTALERREVTPVGADHPEPVDVRIVSATNLDEARLHDPQVFRTDLLFRLNTIVVPVPPLRARREDIVPLIQRYLSVYARHYDKPMRPLDDAAVAALEAHSWPGNVRALRHACERAVILALGPTLTAADFGLGNLRPSAGQPMVNNDALKLDVRERETIAVALSRSDGNISSAVKLLGLSRTALYRRMEKHGL